MAENAARKYAALARFEQLQGHTPAALTAIGKAVAGSPSIRIQFHAARIDVDAGDLVKAQKIATSLVAQSLGTRAGIQMLRSQALGNRSGAELRIQYLGD